MILLSTKTMFLTSVIFACGYLTMVNAGITTTTTTATSTTMTSSPNDQSATTTNVHQAIPIQTSSGLLKGKMATNSQGNVREYLAIPYAQKPTRFALPQPLFTPDMVRDATQFGAACLQPAHLQETMSPLLNTNHTWTSEDCLNLNVYVPVLSQTKTLYSVAENENVVEGEGKQQHQVPVIVWFPGEGFDYAMAQQFDGGYLATLGQSVVITINYRVFAFGFLSTLTADAPGNVGLWDQRMALKWIRKNVAAFGGDPEKITLMGRFTGSMSITAQMTSPVNRENGSQDEEMASDGPIFNRAILQSGVATGNWVFESEPRTVALRLADAVGCGVDSASSAATVAIHQLEKVVRCLRELPAETLVEKALGMSWRPVLDGRFLTEDPMESMRHGRVLDIDVMLGVNSDEGSLCLLSLYYTNSTYYEKVVRNTLTKDDFDNLLNGAVEDFTKMKSPLQKLAHHEYNHNIDNNKDRNGDNKSLRDSYVQFCGSMYITSQMEQAARYLARSQSQRSHLLGDDAMEERVTKRVFMYEFDHRPSFSIHPDFIRAAHGDDMLFSLGLVHKSDSVTQEELQLSKKIIQSFSSFANNGQPVFKSSSRSSENVIWPQYKDEGRQVLHFSTSVIVRPSVHDREVSFWHTVIPSVSSVIVDNNNINNQLLRGHHQFGPGDFEVVALTNGTAGYIVGTLISVQTTEYVLLTMICLTMLLVVVVAIAPYLMMNRRTKKEGMLMEY